MPFVLVCKLYKNQKKIVDIPEKFPNTLRFLKMYKNCFWQKNWAGLNMLTIPQALLCCINSVFFLNFLTISRFLCLNLLTSSFLIHIGMQQLLRQRPTYIEKKHYHVSKKFSIWVLYGTQMLYFNPMIFPLEHLSLL